MLPFGVTIPAAVLQGAEIPEGLMNNPVYGLTFGNAESRLFLFSAQRFNIESMQKVFLCHICV
jgi:hypothetical protein